MELDGEVGGGRVELLGATAADVLPQDTGRELVPVINGQDVAVAQVQAGKGSAERSLVSPGAQGNPASMLLTQTQGTWVMDPASSRP